MKGQWIGKYSGSNTGQIIVELDEQPDCYLGWAYLFDLREGWPHSSAFIRTPNKNKEQEFEVGVGPINVNVAGLTNWDSIKSQHPDFTFPSSAKLKVKTKMNTLNIEWKTDIGTTGKTRISKSHAEKNSEIVPSNINSWKEFKEHVSQLPSRKFIFRGQKEAKSWRLRSHFHRSGRADTKRLIYQDIPELFRATVNLTAHKFNLSNADELGAFYALVQHHGYPTPLLDWTYSPYVAAYFAFSEIPKLNEPGAKHCRIHMFDSQKWASDWSQPVQIAGVKPHFSLLEPLALGNPRMIQQQALVTLTNVDDIETYIREKEAEKKTTYLSVVDLPFTARSEVMRDLEMMGVTAASLFPGIDGVCKYQRERLFDV